LLHLHIRNCICLTSPGEQKEEGDDGSKAVKKKNPNVTVFIPKSVKGLRDLAGSVSSPSSTSSSSPSTHARLLPLLLVCICHCINNAFLDAIDQCPFLGLVNDRIHALIIYLRKAAYSG
jgi:hypothetical protein